ncbi:MAG TPA: methionine biosynthesis protein MetW [Candidatus Moranbacteria bacterium]|nr:methionine biosynthesis protein MetW [Candidatus Moranbacteria bacterium]HSA08597.1 methionine biosynthesis protein MetW [Candidatus Moranbacteria bacterium]
MIKKIKTFFWELFRPMPLDNNFENYDEYWQSRGFHAPSLNRAKIISKHIKIKAKILDIGCGDGTIIDYLSKNNEPQEIIGIDVSQKAVDYVKAKGYKAFKIDVFSDEFVDFIKDKKFDYIIITEVLEHVQDPEKIMLSVKNYFTESIFISIPNAGFFVNRLRLLFGRFPLVMIQQNIKEHIRFWTSKDFIYWCNYLGFKIDNTFVSAGLYFKPLEFLEKLYPSLFAQQIIYKIKNEKE